MSTSASRATLWIPAGLIALALLPAIGGTVRLLEVQSGVITEANARFLSAPLPLVIHFLSSIIYFVLGALQFSPGFRSRHLGWHRAAGRVLVPAGLLCALSGMWMAHFYPPYLGDGLALYVIRMMVGVAMILFICLGLAAIRRRDVASHRPWMMRAYALGIAAGTQPLTLGIAIGVASLEEVPYTIGLAAGWLLNLAVAEWFIRRKRPVVG
ncbi:MAG: hypothetical protein A3H44_01170 [Gammaproteobacteria bacterium RIFCSPLOWO2_02_FULL_57_10]|nr:MAG: hypothetical protein A3H44_01170 [Gammaproteobacteria bacterium RIFCSPLOWO2_02_FULL_57_10]